MQRNKIAITEKILQKMTSKFWNKLSQYESVEKFKFSTEWLCKFKKKYDIKKQIKHNKVESIDKKIIETQLKEFCIFVKII